VLSAYSFYLCLTEIYILHFDHVESYTKEWAKFLFWYNFVYKLLKWIKKKNLTMDKLCNYYIILFKFVMRLDNVS